MGAQRSRELTMALQRIEAANRTPGSQISRYTTSIIVINFGNPNLVGARNDAQNCRVRALLERIAKCKSAGRDSDQV